ncbi:MAG: hypothetical protein R3305_02945 [Gammaproteobacteria bacterium]|nr:hypothetical protein [Gammaproteobacteria bacterium]
MNENRPNQMASDSERERQIAERASELFADSVRGLDGQTRSRLAQARAKAVDAAQRRRFSFWLEPRQLLPASGVAAAVLAVALFWQPGFETEVVPVEANVIDDFDILLEGENLDLFEELEFYAWLLEQPEFQDAAGEDGTG